MLRHSCSRGRPECLSPFSSWSSSSSSLLSSTSSSSSGTRRGSDASRSWKPWCVLTRALLRSRRTLWSSGRDSGFSVLWRHEATGSTAFSFPTGSWEPPVALYTSSAFSISSTTFGRRILSAEVSLAADSRSCSPLSVPTTVPSELGGAPPLRIATSKKTSASGIPRCTGGDGSKTLSACFSTSLSSPSRLCISARMEATDSKTVLASDWPGASSARRPLSTSC
mmetsp:Transcript_11309/g.42220  ORF Transcript_11309/g.42220 Transcript_11309/m.42220 type:complete len:224 (-) Transcript_11309:731-1402(-)